MTDEPMPAPSSSTSLTANSSEGANSSTEDKTRLISLAEAAEMYGFSHVHLRQMAREGRLKAKKVGRYWVTTPADVEAYIVSRKPTGRFREDIQVDS